MPRWLDGYRVRLEKRPASYARITGEKWRRLGATPGISATGPRTSGSGWPKRPWREVPAEWWPRLLPGIAAGATHPLIRAGHAGRAVPGRRRPARRRGGAARPGLSGLGALAYVAWDPRCSVRRLKAIGCGA